MDGLSAEVVAERTGVDVSTARRWKAGKTRLPASARMILEADLGCFGRAWRGWKIHGNQLVSPEGIAVSMSNVRAYPFMVQQIAILQADNRQIRGLDEQPTAAELPAITGVKVAV